MKRNAIIAVVGVFLLGLLCGAVVGRFYLGSYRWTRQLERRHLSSLTEALALSEKQKNTLAPILNEAQLELLQRRMEWLEKSGDAVDRLANRLRPLLEAEQTAKLDKLTAQFRSEKEQRIERLKHRRDSLRKDKPAR